jgi:hypothetical protein
MSEKIVSLPGVTISYQREIGISSREMLLDICDSVEKELNKIDGEFEEKEDKIYMYWLQHIEVSLKDKLGEDDSKDAYQDGLKTLSSVRKDEDGIYANVSGLAKNIVWDIRSSVLQNPKNNYEKQSAWGNGIRFLLEKVCEASEKSLKSYKDRVRVKAHEIGKKYKISLPIY